MSRDNTQPFDRGETYYGPDQAIDTNNLGGGQWLGQQKVFEDYDFSVAGSVKPHRSGRTVTVRCVRNASGLTLRGKEFVQLDSLGQTITGRVVNDAQHGYPIDEFLPTTGVRNGDICYVVVEGPAMMFTPMTGGGFNGDIAAGARLQSVTTANGSTAAGTTTEGGRVANFSTVAATTVAQFNSLLAHAANWVATALTARTTGNTNADILALVRYRW